MQDTDEADVLGDWTVPETGFDGGDDPLDEAPFTAEELMCLAAELMPDAVQPPRAGGRA